MIYKRGRYYSIKFKYRGKVIRKSTRAMDASTARRIETEVRRDLALEEYGIYTKEVPTLGEFLKETFLPYCEKTVKPSSLRYYKYGASLLKDLDIRLDKITNLNAMSIADAHKSLSPSTINAALRTLYRALRLAEEWGYIGRAQKIRLLGGEKQRTQVLTAAEKQVYLAACTQPWKDIATFILETGMRPGEVFTLRWEDLGEDMLYIQQGKSEAAKRPLPITAPMREILDRRGNHKEGWIFPAKNRDGHVNRDTVKKAHAKAVISAGIAYFVPYILRHTALTELGDAEVSPFTIMKIAGHSSISTTARYVHPSIPAIKRAFVKKGSQ